GSPTHLLSVHVADQRTLVDRIFFAHAASLRQTAYFARLKFRGFLHSFKPKSAPPGNSTAYVWAVRKGAPPSLYTIHRIVGGTRM
ncbi:MAG TPA: hypothetical protein VNO32_54540, partial [Candidatus Acidoferrum sp.]|nr:hypothetical protein [Candidatus Acidoferrum sp.]